jgi:hypothetical protein
MLHLARETNSATQTCRAMSWAAPVQCARTLLKVTMSHGRRPCRRATSTLVSSGNATSRRREPPEAPFVVDAFFAPRNSTTDDASGPALCALCACPRYFRRRARSVPCTYLLAIARQCPRRPFGRLMSSAWTQRMKPSVVPLGMLRSAPRLRISVRVPYPDHSPVPLAL